MKKRPPQTKREIIMETRERQESAAVGEKELREIQHALVGKFGEGAVDSPAAIARVLADAGAELRHPEVIEFDARWREKEIEKRASVRSAVSADKPLTLSSAERLIAKLEKSRRRFEHKADKASLRAARELAIAERQRAESFARSSRLNDQRRLEQTEIAEWLRVWLQTPDLFADWIDLRRRSLEFQKRFGVRRQA